MQTTGKTNKHNRKSRIEDIRTRNKHKKDKVEGRVTAAHRKLTNLKAEANFYTKKSSCFAG